MTSLSLPWKWEVCMASDFSWNKKKKYHITHTTKRVNDYNSSTWDIHLLSFGIIHHWSLHFKYKGCELLSGKVHALSVIDSLASALCGVLCSSHSINFYCRNKEVSSELLKNLHIYFHWESISKCKKLNSYELKHYRCKIEFLGTDFWNLLSFNHCSKTGKLVEST